MPPRDPVGDCGNVMAEPELRLGFAVSALIDSATQALCDACGVERHPDRRIHHPIALETANVAGAAWCDR